MTRWTGNAPSALDDALYRELINCRITPPDKTRMADGPTARWAELEREREKWALVREVGDELPFTDGAVA